MKKELQNVTPSDILPQTTVNQYGEKSVHIGQVDNMSQNVFVIPMVQQLANGTIQPVNKQLNTSCYHLFVLGGENFIDNHFIISPERALCQYWTNEVLREKYGKLTDECIDELKTFPALFVPETAGYYAKASEEQQAFWGILEDIRIQDNGIKIRYKSIWPIPLQNICNIGFELGIMDLTKAISELNRTHWAIKNINLMEELKDANISIFGV